MAFVDRGTSRLYFESAGEGPALVLSHGVGGNHASWFLQIAALADRFRVISWDHRGFGLSSDAEGLGRAGFIDDLKAVLDAADVDRCVLIGQSMGGGTSLGFACTYPERVAGLVMADSLAQAALPPAIARRMADNATKTANLTQIERVLGETFQRENPAGAILYSQIAGFNATNLRTLQGEMSSFDAETLSRTGVPTLFIVGDEDILFPPWAVRAFQSDVAQSRYVELARTGHTACYERPDAFNAALLTWLHDIGYTPRSSGH
jgi:3-oxoadipate enol-lactonase